MKKEKLKISLFLELIILIIVLALTSVLITNNDNIEESSFLVNVDLETEINIKIKELNKKYGIDIIYGIETKEIVKNVKGNILLNEDIILKNLNIIENALSKYSNDFFKKDKLTIILLKSFNNNNLALASKNNLGEYKIYLSDNVNFERSIHHEIYHVFEYMNNTENNKNHIKWDKLNPEGFMYNNDLNLLNNNYVFGSNIEDKNIYFVSKYSKTSGREDRAEIFTEIMIDKYDFSNNINIINKIDVIEDIINSTNSKVLIDVNKYDN